MESTATIVHEGGTNVKRIRHLLTSNLLVLALIFSHCAVPAAAPSTDAPAATDAYLETQMRAQQIPGVSLAVFKHGVPIYVKSYGVATLEHAVPAKPETLFQIGSIGKQFTAVALMLLAKEHRLELDAPLDKYLPEVPPNWHAVTLRRMLNHQSGIPQLNDTDHQRLDLHREYSDAELVQLASSQPLDFEPGTDASYSDTAYVLLGVVINRTLPGFYGDFLRARVFGPLGMSRTRVLSDTDIIPDRASGYELSATGSVQNQAWVSAALNRTADGSLYSTALDLGRWDAALYGETILSQTDLARMWTIDPLSDNQLPLYHYGYGWEINALRGEPVIEYDGNWQGFQASMARYVHQGLTVVVLTNRSLCRAQRLAHTVAGYFDPTLKPYDLAAHDVMPEKTQRFRQLLAAAAAGQGSAGWSRALTRELKSAGPIKNVVLSEEYVATGSTRPGASGHSIERVYRVELALIDDYFRVRYGRAGNVEALDLYREF